MGFAVLVGGQLGRRAAVPGGDAVVRQAAAIIEANWPLIERGARALLAAGRLTREEVERLLTAPPPGEWRSPRWD